MVNRRIFLIAVAFGILVPFILYTFEGWGAGGIVVFVLVYLFLWCDS